MTFNPETWKSVFQRVSVIFWGGVNPPGGVHLPGEAKIGEKEVFRGAEGAAKNF